MSLFSDLAKVREAQLNAAISRHQVGVPAAALLARGRQHPLTTVGLAAGSGFVLGSLNVHPLRVPGLGALLSGGLSEGVSLVTRLITDFGAAGLGAAAADMFGEEDRNP